MVRNGYDPLDVYTRTRGRTHRRRGAVNGSLEVDSLEYVPRLVVPWPTDSSTLSLSCSRPTWPLFTSRNPAASLTLLCQLPVPFHPSASLLLQPVLTVIPHSGCWWCGDRLEGGPAPRKQREGFRLPNWLGNESAARGTQDALKILVDLVALLS